ncbi:hypothetical protein D0Z07_9338 [Hyphodiscus hymeniophilus]|uniref:Rhodanese domain-containing protein n=1 Tax=Hyphodiscus hymeniophilus TaxID=353542 RepID=A0A9P6SMF9_9HELO|nr:hypothetical protein D0Z07_9338 [Hyphodiscus hymeniophilus]
MSQINNLNVFKGEDGLIKFFDPEEAPLLPLVELPSRLNPYHGDKVRIYCKMMTALPAQNVKALPGWLMSQMGLHHLPRLSLSPAQAPPSFHSRWHHAPFLASRMFMLMHLYGGPAQPRIDDERGIVAKVKLLAVNNEQVFCPSQYDNNQNFAAHIRWTGPQILKQLPEITMFCAGMGSAGCVTGTGSFLKANRPKCTVIGVCNAQGDSIPGPRPFPLFTSVKFPWGENVDHVEEVGSVVSYRLSLQLSREGLICGPSSGMALQGLFNRLGKAKAAGSLENYRDENGLISCVFLCCDLPYQYIDGYFDRLDAEEIHPILDSDLSGIDVHKYDPSWELTSAQVLESVRRHQSCDADAQDRSNTANQAIDVVPHNMIILDLRTSGDFSSTRLIGAINKPLQTLKPASLSPFDDKETLKNQWIELEHGFFDAEERRLGHLNGQYFLLICYNGETSRVACSVMRSKSLESYSCCGGMLEILKTAGEHSALRDQVLQSS